MEERDERYLRAAAEFGAPLARLARAYEANPDQQRDLLQDIHFALWRSLEKFNGRCSLRTWVYRVAHNVVISTRLRRRQRRAHLVSLQELAETANEEDIEQVAGEHQLLAQLKITGLSPGAVTTRIHRAKALLARNFRQGESR